MINLKEGFHVEDNNEDSKNGRTSRRALSGILLGGSLGAIGSAAAKESSPPKSVQELHDQLAIAQLIYRYGEAADNLDAKAMDDCFASNGVLMMGPTSKLEGKFAEKMFENVHSKYACTMHNVQSHVYTVTKDTASGWSYSIASHVKKDGGSYIGQDHYIRYDDELVREGNKWRFLKRKLQTLFTKIAPVTFIAQPESRGEK